MNYESVRESLNIEYDVKLDTKQGNKSYKIKKDKDIKRKLFDIKDSLINGDIEKIAIYKDETLIIGNDDLKKKSINDLMRML